MMRLFLVCHGATGAVRVAAFPEDEPLDRRGAAAVRRFASNLPRKGRALTSPTLRARQTAEALGLAAAVDTGLRALDYGRWRGRSLAAVAAEAPDAVALWTSDPTAAPHGGESIAELLARVAAWLTALPAQRGALVAVTHAEVMRAAVVYVLAAPVTSFWRIDIAPLTVVELSRNGENWSLRAIGGPRSARAPAGATSSKG